MTFFKRFYIFVYSKNQSTNTFILSTYFSLIHNFLCYFCKQICIFTMLTFNPLKLSWARIFVIQPLFQLYRFELFFAINMNWNLNECWQLTNELINFLLSNISSLLFIKNIIQLYVLKWKVERLNIKLYALKLQVSCLKVKL